MVADPMAAGPPRRLAIAVFSDASGWEVMRSRPWFMPDLDRRQQVTSIFGYSSACIPAIFTGRKPNENGHWSSFFYSPETSPFKMLRHMKWLPSSVVDRGRVRSYLSKAIAAVYKYTGYFQIYSLPFEILNLFDYAEKRDILRPGGINEGDSIFDRLVANGTPHFVSEWRKSEEYNFDVLRSQIETEEISFAYVHTARLDALMHDESKDSPRVDILLREHQEQLRRTLEVAHAHYDEVRVAFFSDHGMCTVEHVVDLMPQVDALDLCYGTDYVGIYDSTMLRFWFLRPGAEQKIRQALPDAAHGRWVREEEHREYGTYWSDGKFCDAVYALEPSYLLNPSHMGNVPLKGMHGYRPDHPDSYSALLMNFDSKKPITEITDYFELMLDMAAWAAGPRPSTDP